MEYANEQAPCADAVIVPHLFQIQRPFVLKCIFFLVTVSQVFLKAKSLHRVSNMDYSLHLSIPEPPPAPYDSCMSSSVRFWIIQYITLIQQLHFRRLCVAN